MPSCMAFSKFFFMNILGVIPARYHSARFPGKPLADIRGKSMIQRVYEQASMAHSLSNLVVATDDERIFKHVSDFGGKVLMTNTHHQSGTERCNEVLTLLNPDEDFDIVVNIQGDEPFIKPSQIDLVADCFSNDAVEIATLVKPLKDKEALRSHHTVKVIVNKHNKALYFSRRLIPYTKEELPENQWPLYYKHIGIYAYRAQVLKAICKLPPSSLEKAESLEQLRWLENNYQIFVNYTEEEGVSIDTPEDLKKIL